MQKGEGETGKLEIWYGMQEFGERLNNEVFVIYPDIKKKKVLISSAMKSDVRTHLPLSVQRVCAD